MKLLAVLTLASCLTSAYAVEDFGGIGLDSSIPKEQVSILKNDLRYLFQNPNAVNDDEFLATTKIKAGSGDHLHNFILNRVKYIVGEYFDLEGNIVGVKNNYKFPQTPLPDGISHLQSVNQVRTVMTNIGGALYLGGKIEKMLIGLKVDKQTIAIKSPRTGVLQVGEGLFYEGFQINKDNVNAPANSISRLGTLFHEARHSDGNGKSTGFVHAQCPPGHSYEGHHACEVSGNGSYSVGALAERHMLKNCQGCSDKDKMVLSAAIADNFDRIVDMNKARELVNAAVELRTSLYMLDVYKRNVWPDTMKEKVDTEIANLEKKIADLKVKIATMSLKPDTKPAFLDDAPEGEYKDLPVEKSSKLMKVSLKK